MDSIKLELLIEILDSLTSIKCVGTDCVDNYCCTKYIRLKDSKLIIIDTTEDEISRETFKKYLDLIGESDILNLFP